MADKQSPLKNEYGLNPNMERFCREYVANGYHPQEAYLVAYKGCLPTSAAANAYRLMKDKRIKDYIKFLQKEKVEELNISADRILEELSTMAFAEKGDEDYGANVKLKALDLLQKQLGLQQQKIRADIDTNQEIKVTIEDD